MNGKALKRSLPDVAIFLLVFATYIPALRGGFIWDDDAHVTHNRYVVGPGTLREVWTSPAAAYYPLALTSFRIEHALWNLHPFPYHLVNVLMHAACGILLRHVLLNLGTIPAAAWLGSILWSLHPVQTESVAWITELKNTQSGVFYLLSLLLFLVWLRKKGGHAGWIYALFLLSAVMALLSKTSTVMLPIVAALCTWWLEGRWSWKPIKFLSPLVVISASAGVWTVWEQKFHSGAFGNDWTQRFLERVAVAGDSIWFYLSKLLWPYPLIFIYPRWTVDVHSVLSFVPAVAAIAVLIVLWRFRNGRTRSVFFAAAYFVISLFPVLDFFDVYFFRYSFVGDHFQYLAAMGPLALAGAAVVWVFDRSAKTWLVPFVSAGLVVGLGMMTALHTMIFHDDETLWRDTIAGNPDAWLAHNNLATIFLERGDTAGASVELETTLRLQPNDAEGHANLANIFFESGRFDEAATQFQLALEGEPDYPRIHDYLGVSLMMTGRLEDGLEHMQRAVELDPNNATAREHLGLGLWRDGKIDQAMQQFETGVAIDPSGTAPRMRYGTALLTLERYAEAQAQFLEILRVSPDYEPAHKFLGVALFELHRKDEAVHHLEEAVRLDPTDDDAKEKLKEITRVKN